MIKKNFHGRLGNFLIQSVCVSIIAKKHNLKVENYNSLYDFSLLGLKLYNGELIYNDLVYTLDDKLMSILESDQINYGILYDGYAEVKEFVLKYRKEILDHFDLKYDNIDNNDLFIHIRLDDVENKTPGLDYYIKAIESINYNKGYISSDSKNHFIIKTLIERYNLILYDDTPINTINFGKNFNNLILSGGTFSWWIGFLSKAKTIIYPKNYERWHGDIFVFEDWKNI